MSGLFGNDAISDTIGGMSDADVEAAMMQNFNQPGGWQDTKKAEEDSDKQAAKGKDSGLGMKYSEAPDMSKMYAGASAVPNLLNFGAQAQQDQTQVKSPGFNKYLQSLLGV